MSYKPMAIFASTVIAGLFSATASAATLYLNDVSPSANMTITFPTLSAETTPYVGHINWTFDRTNSDNAILDTLVTGSSLTTFCMEGTQNVYLNQNSSFANVFSDPAMAPQDNVGSHYQMGGANAATLTKFWNTHYSESSLNNANAAAFQLGVWEIVYDGGTDLSSGLFKASAVPSDSTSLVAFNQAQSWLSGLGAANPTEHYQLYVLSDPGLQDQVFGVQSFGNVPPVPLPAALPAGLSGLIGLGLVRRFRKRPS